MSQKSHRGEHEMIDKLFLELSQVTTVATARELHLLDLLRQALHSMPLARNRTARQKRLYQEIEVILTEHGMLEGPAEEDE